MAHKYVRVALREEDEPHFRERGALNLQLRRADLVQEKRADGLRRDARGFRARIAESAGRDRGESDGLKSVLDCERERVVITSGQQFRLTPAVIAPDGADSVNHMTRGQVARRCDDGLARRQPIRVARAAYFLALGQNLWPARAMDRAVHAAAAEQARIGRVYNRVHLLLCDVAAKDANAPIEKISHCST